MNDEQSHDITLWRRVVVGALAGLFGWAAYLQLNDDAALLWIILYGVGAVITAAAAAGWPLSRRYATALSFAYLGGAAYLAAEIFWFGTATAMYEQTAGEPASLFALKEGREMFGMAFVAAGIVLSSRSD